METQTPQTQPQGMRSTALPRTVEEIAAEIAANAAEMFDFTGEVLVPYLPFTQAQPYLKEGVTAEQWAECQQPLTREAVIAEMRDYMEFAWGKAADHRGLSAARSLARMQAWLWLLGDADTLAYARASRHYPNYGAPVLKRICQVYGFPLPTASGVLRMAEGRACRAGCNEGCGQDDETMEDT